MTTKSKTKPHETVIDKTSGEPSTNVTAATTDKAPVQNDEAAAGAAALDALMGEGRQLDDVTKDAQAVKPAAVRLDTAAVPASLRPTLRVKKIDSAAQLPQYHSAGAACFDLHALTPGHVAAGGAMTFQTGLAFEVPEGFVMMVYSRSGHGAKNGVRLANGTGVIDSDYRGEIVVTLANDHHRSSFEVSAGDRIAQALLVKVDQWHIEEAEELSATARGANGHGSTGA